ncbi:MAG: DUF2202 domain-containing protein [Thermodesulfobacteriota bacterium]
MAHELARALTTALQDEYKARATYRKILAAFGHVRPFVNIVESEERHIRALTRLFAKHGIPLPHDEWPERVTAPASLHEACVAAVEAERQNAALYAGLMDATSDYPDVQETFRRLLASSEDKHLPAFERCLAREARRAVPLPHGGPGGARCRRRRRGGA